MDFVYCWWMVRCLDPRSALVSHGNVLVWKERFGNEVGGKAGCVAVGVGGWTLDSLIYDPGPEGEGKGGRGKGKWKAVEWMLEFKERREESGVEEGS